MSTKLTIKEAVSVIPVSESTLRRDVSSGKVSSEKDLQGHRQIDTAELIRVYGELKKPDNAPTDPNDTLRECHLNTDDTPTIIALLENQVADMKSQVERMESQLSTATAEKAQLLDLLSMEKDEKRALMPPVEEKEKSRNWLLRLVGAR